ncbi:phosphate ABC transporter substrate-binding protein PstS [Mycobacterium sp. CBMA271]|uniref:phosphate ABC transporter substrate-binding protein PstS n=1 Tax=unclassified Mycobacteroides TaxID=2618759 RepID=UPI0013242843|nr:MULTISPECIES: phosphate ABC transporter substrate-binding protein PstS [unclassified Mycobacteroides]MUM15827.1 phosphate ABC transporter substrate-binding protein PstS [Mycobacteroides sp. CBMA 326]MUM24438.1 phosphate ABC transporter substrate-binding protein PstS [Mycobacteroides sp. CBMA 271]
MNLKSTGTRIFAATAAIALSASLAACGSDNTTGGSSSTSGSASASGDCAGKSKLSAEGSSAQKNAFDIFANEYSTACPGKSINYNPTGSGKGRDNFIAAQVDIGGSDSALSEEEAAKAKERCGGNEAWNLPLVFGPIALAYNIPGVDKLVLNADAAAKIFTGAITTWNDPELATLNPGVTLPDTKVTPVYRKDKSGTSENFGKYLTTAAPESWTKGSSGTWEGGAGESAEKSSGVAEKVKSLPGAITYVEKGYADDLKMPYAQIDSGAGAVALTAETAAASVETAKFAGEGNDLKLDLASIYGTKTAGAYPIVLATYEIVCSKGYKDAEVAAAVKSFLTVAVNQGQKGLADVGYAPLPTQFKSRLETAIKAIS